MKDKRISRLAEVLFLILFIVASAAPVNFFIDVNSNDGPLHA